MNVSLPETVTTVADARAGLSTALKTFRRSQASPPVVLGSHRKPEAVLIPFARYQELVSRPHSTRPVMDEIRARRDLVRRIAALNNVGAIAVFGSVARGDETSSSDIDLIVDPGVNTSYFHLAQLAIDLEQLFGHPVDLVSRDALDPLRDADILAEAIPL